MICTRPGTGLARLLALALLALVAACGGGGGSGTTTPIATTTPPPTMPVAPTAANLVAVTVDSGPATLGAGSSPSRAVDLPFVSVTICVPGTATCQTIDHIQVDTGSVGLRILRSVLTTNLAAGLPGQTDPAGNPVGECYGFVDGYVFGSVRAADFTIGGESVAGMAIQIVGDTGRFASAPPDCTAGGGAAMTAVADLAANGILGIGTTRTDCGSYCTAAGGSGAATYYDCPASGCAGVIARAATTAAPFQQLPNPVAAMAADNNGTVLVLPALPQTGTATASGMLYFGIGTASNNRLTAANVLTTTLEGDSNGSGLVTATYRGQSLPVSYIDSGSSAYFFVDRSIAGCTGASESGYYCPTAPLALTPTLTGTNGRVADASFTLYNAHTLFQSNNAAVPGIGANPGAVDGFDPPSDSFDFGAPFFFGRSIFTAIEGTMAGGNAGPFFAY